MSGLMLWLMVGMSGAQAQSCENPTWIANEVEEYIGNFLLAEATDAIGRAETAFACAGVAERSVLARLFNAQGAVAFFSDDKEAAAIGFLAAYRSDPDVWNATFGADARKLYVDTASAAAADAGVIKVLPVPRGNQVYIDGMPVEPPFAAAGGLHLLQIANAKGDLLFAKRVMIPASSEVVVVSGISGNSAAQIPTASAPAPVQMVPNPLLVAGVAMVGIGAATGAVTWAVNDNPEAVVSEEYETAMKVANVAGWSLAGLGVGVGVAGVFGGPKTRAADVRIDTSSR